jgi:hypothetical protein
MLIVKPLSANTASASCGAGNGEKTERMVTFLAITAAPYSSEEGPVITILTTVDAPKVSVPDMINLCVRSVAGVSGV